MEFQLPIIQCTELRFLTRGFCFVQWRASSCCQRVTGNSGLGPLSCCFNMANYFEGICHLRTIKPVRSQSWHPDWSTKCGVFRQVERAVRAGQFQSQKGQKWFKMTDLSKITFTFWKCWDKSAGDSTGPASWLFFFSLFLLSPELLHPEPKSTGILKRSVSWERVCAILSQMTF